MSVVIVYPDVPPNPPECPRCGNADPGKFEAISSPPSISCACGERFKTQSGWIPYVRAYQEALDSQVQLDQWDAAMASQVRGVAR